MFYQRDLTAQMQGGSMLVQVREFMGTCGNVFLHFLVAGRIYFLWFVIYSAAGWLYESTICSQIKYHKFINRGYLRGPWIPIYGAGAVLNYWLIGWIGNVPAIFVAAMFTSGVVEYITSYAMERMFHKRWWDYTRYRYNLNGRICLYGCIIFGIGNVILIRFVHPVIMQLTAAIPELVLTRVVLFLYLLFVVDVVYTTVHMETVRARMEKLVRQMRDRKECYLYMAGEQKEYCKIYFEEKKERCSSFVEEKKERCSSFVEERKELCVQYVEKVKDRFRG